MLIAEYGNHTFEGYGWDWDSIIGGFTKLAETGGNLYFNKKAMDLKKREMAHETVLAQLKAKEAELLSSLKNPVSIVSGALPASMRPYTPYILLGGGSLILLVVFLMLKRRRK